MPHAVLQKCLSGIFVWQVSLSGFIFTIGGNGCNRPTSL